MSAEVAVRIERARAELAEARLGDALGTLDDVVRATSEPAQLEEMRVIALEGLERAGRFGKGGWKGLLKEIDKQIARCGVAV